MIGNKTGNLGENIVAKHLVAKGFDILHRNYSKPYGEIDIVCEKQGIVHFIEVKAVSCEINGDDSRETSNPAENVDKYKLRKLGRVIQAYIAEFHAHLSKTCPPRHGEQVKDWQFDVYTVEIDRDSKKARVTVLQNQILPE